MSMDPKQPLNTIDFKNAIKAGDFAQFAVAMAGQDWSRHENVSESAVTLVRFCSNSKNSVDYRFLFMLKTAFPAEALEAHMGLYKKANFTESMTDIPGEDWENEVDSNYTAAAFMDAVIAPSDDREQALDLDWERMSEMRQSLKSLAHEYINSTGFAADPRSYDIIAEAKPDAAGYMNLRLAFYQHAGQNPDLALFALHRIFEITESHADLSHLFDYHDYIDDIEDQYYDDGFDDEDDSDPDPGDYYAIEDDEDGPDRADWWKPGYGPEPNY